MARFDVRILNKLLDSYERSSLAKGTNKVAVHIDFRFNKRRFRNTLTKVLLPMRRSMTGPMNLRKKGLSGLYGNGEKKIILLKS